MSDIFEPTQEVAEEFRALLADPSARAAFTELRHQAAEKDVKRHYEHVLQAVSSTPWAVRPEILALIVDLLAFRVAGGSLSQEEIEARIGAARRAPAPDGAAGVAVLPLHGVIMPKASMMSEMSGGTSIERFRGQFREAMGRKDISSIVLDVNSPGGMVDGVPEMAAEIRAARGTKPIVAVANTEASSAAYWLASQADEFVATRSGRVGSIGVFAAHEDESAKAEAEGVRTTLVSAGRYKTEGNPFEPLTDEAKAHMQSMVDEYYGMFVADVAAGRGIDVGDVRTGYGEGREVTASTALNTGMIDRVASTEEIVSEMLAAGRLQAAAMVVPFAEAATLGTFSAEPTDPAFMLPLDFEAAVDNSAWDGNRAMGMCSTAADYAQICAAAHTVGEPNQRQHWALPHHYLGRGPNAEGVRAALSRVPQTQNITDAQRQSAQSHLDAHMREINPDSAAALTPELADEVSLRATLGLLSA
jgi:signal peptide peptidase SppA